MRVRSQNCHFWVNYPFNFVPVITWDHFLRLNTNYYICVMFMKGYMISADVLGEDGSGKTTLMSKLHGAEHNKRGRGLEYLYLNVQDEDRDGECVYTGEKQVIHD